MAETEAGTGAGAAGGQSGAGQAGSQGGAGQAGTAAGGTSNISSPWHANVDQTIRDFWAGKKYDTSDPVKLVDVVTRNYQNAEKFLGVPPEELLRLPKPNADTTEITNFWNRVGVPKEAKDYDFTGVPTKSVDGKDVDPAFLDAMRTSLHANRVPKEFAANIVKDFLKHQDAQKQAELAEKTAHVQEQTQQLEKNWGNRAAYNMTVARDAMERFGKLAGLTPEQTDAAVDALSKVGGIGAAPVLEMFRQIGARMGEAPFIAAGQRPGGEELGAVSREDAQRQIAALKEDKDFAQRLLAGNVEARNRWRNLHQIATGVVTTAA